MNNKKNEKTKQKEFKYRKRGFGNLGVLTKIKVLKYLDSNYMKNFRYQQRAPNTLFTP